MFRIRSSLFEGFFSIRTMKIPANLVLLSEKFNH